MMFGGSTPQLQHLSLRLVSQYVSSSGCERNWSIFALLHTKVHNRLTHKKLNKLVYVNYTLRLQLEDVSDQRDDEGYIIEQLGQLNFYDEKNPVREWMGYCRLNREPILDEEDEDSDVPIPSHLVRDQIDPKDICATTGDDCISDWACRNVGTTHIGKRMLQSVPKQDDPKRQKGKKKVPEKPVTSDTSTDDGDGQLVHRTRSPGIVARLKMMLMVVVVVVEFVSQVYTRTIPHMYDVYDYN
jgi:hypothetical protein